MPDISEIQAEIQRRGLGNTGPSKDEIQAELARRRGQGPVSLEQGPDSGQFMGGRDQISPNIGGAGTRLPSYFSPEAGFARLPAQTPSALRLGLPSQPAEATRVDPNAANYIPMYHPETGAPVNPLGGIIPPGTTESMLNKVVGPQQPLPDKLLSPEGIKAMASRTVTGFPRLLAGITYGPLEDPLRAPKGIYDFIMGKAEDIGAGTFAEKPNPEWSLENQNVPYTIPYTPEERYAARRRMAEDIPGLALFLSPFLKGVKGAPRGLRGVSALDAETMAKPPPRPSMEAQWAMSQKPKPKEAPYAEGLREDAGQVQVGGDVRPGGEAKGRPDLELKAPKQPGGAKTPEAIAKEHGIEFQGQSERPVRVGGKVQRTPEGKVKTTPVYEFRDPQTKDAQGLAGNFTVFDLKDVGKELEAHRQRFVGEKQPPAPPAPPSPKGKEPWEYSRKDFVNELESEAKKVGLGSAIELQLLQALEGGAMLRDRLPATRSPKLEYGEKLTQIVRESGVTKGTIREAVQAYHKKQVEQAIDEGKIKSHPDYPELGKKKPTIISREGEVRALLRQGMGEDLRAQIIYKPVGSTKGIVKVGGEDFVIDDISRLKRAGVKFEGGEGKTKWPGVKVQGDVNKLFKKYPQLTVEDFALQPPTISVTAEAMKGTGKGTRKFSKATTQEIELSRQYKKAGITYIRKRGGRNVVLEKITDDPIEGARVNTLTISREKAVGVEENIKRFNAKLAETEANLRPPAAETPKVETPKPQGGGEAGVVGAAKSLIDKAEAAAKERIAKRISESGTKLYDITGAAMEGAGMAKDLAIVGAAKIARGTVDFAVWSAEMMKEFGKEVKPHLKKIWEESHKIARGFAKEPPKVTAKAKPVETTPEPQVVRLNKEETAQLRALVDLQKLPAPMRETIFKTVEEAKGGGYIEKALEVADEVLKTKRAMTRHEHAGAVLKATELFNEHDAAITKASELAEKGYHQAARLERERADVLLDQFDKLTQATDLSGTQQSRALSFRRMGIDRQSMELAPVKQRMQAVKGSKLTERETLQAERVVAEYKEWKRKYEKLEEKYQAEQEARERIIAERVAAIESKKARIKGKAKGRHERIMAERADIKKQLRAIGFRVNDITGVTAEGSYLIGKLAVNYIKEGVTSLDTVVKNVMADIPGIVARDVYEALNAKNPKRLKKARNQTQKKIMQLKRQAQLLVDLEKAERGIFEKGTRRKRPTPKEIKNLQNKIDRLEKEYQLQSKVDKARQGVFEAKKSKSSIISNKIKTLREELATLKKKHELQIKVEKAERGVFDKKRTVNPAPPEIRALQRRLTELRKEAYRENIEAPKIDRAIKTINELQDQLANHYRLRKKGKSIPSEELAALREKIADLRKTMRTQDVLADLNEQLRTGEFKIKPRPIMKRLPPELERAQVEIKVARKKIRAMINDMAPVTPRKVFVETINTLRTLKATADMSATFRQGFAAVAHNPIRATKIFGQSFLPTFSKYKAEVIDNAIRSVDHHYIREKAGLSLPEVEAAKLTAREEMFMSNLVKKVPVLKQITQASERHMVTFLNLNRAAMFDEFLLKYPNATDAQLRAWADFVNIGTGRGNLGKASSVANELSLGIFAPRFAVSRVQYPFMIFKYWKDPILRKEIAKQYVKVATLGATTLAIASQIPGWEVGTDPRSPDWGKIRIGNTRIDIWGGFQQPMRVVTRIGVGVTDKAGITGKELTAQQKEVDPLELVMRFSSYKAAPSITVPLEVYKGKTIVGEKVTPTDVAIRSITPMVYEDIADAYKQEGITMAAVTGGLAFLGVGVNTYEDSETVTRNKIRKFLNEGNKEAAFQLKLEWNIKHPDKEIVNVKTTKELQSGEKSTTTNTQRRRTNTRPTQQRGTQQRRIQP